MFYFLGKKFQFPIKPLELLQNISPKTVSAGLQIPLSLLKSIMLYNVFGKKAKTFEEYLVKGFGKKAYKVLFEGYANKVWDKPQNLSKDIAKIRIPVPNVGELIKNTLTGKSEPKVAAHEFYYPRLGMRQFTRKMATQIEEMEGTIKLNMPITSLTKEGDLFKVMTPEKTYTPTTLISTIPLSSLIHMYDQSTSDAKDRIDKLRYNDIHLVYLFFKKKRILRDNWVFFPEIDIAFNRVSEQKSFSPFMVPHDKTVICAEITNPSLIHLTNEELIERSIKDLIKTNTIKNRDALFDTHVIRLKNIYPIYDIHYKENLQHVLDFLEKHNILTIGRFGLFNYNNVDHCLDMGEVISNHVVENGDMSAWNTTRKKFDEYVIVD